MDKAFLQKSQFSPRKEAIARARLASLPFTDQLTHQLVSGELTFSESIQGSINSDGFTVCLLITLWNVFHKVYELFLSISFL
ncbi:hypothetical protein SAMN05660971_02534 [Halomonas cupida]|uniref:Uncharacterized protein n=1 Tax=Halomonas cupida TaxID=44933 RepID=A0A1M7H951_9GAMM|nr:hypothetical protein SAMN05660971_02534 [Halomonas cupida]